MGHSLRILISGASFAGLSSAHALTQLGHQVTVVEVSPSLRTGGTAVDIKGQTVDTVRRMGLLEAVRANRLSLQRWEIKNARDETVRTLELRAEDEPPSELEFEIERNTLLQLLFDAVRERCTFIFDDCITALRETAEGMDVTFRKGAPRSFDLVLGCDGMHSGVRQLWFGPEAEYTHFLQQYFSITIVDQLLIPRDTAQMFNVPGKAVMLNAYREKTDIILGFVSEREIAYDRRDEAQQRRIIAEQFTGVGWRVPELLRCISASRSFYFDKLAQIRMPTWSRGGWCWWGFRLLPIARGGMGGSLAIDGAAALGEAMRLHPDDWARAFRAYEAQLRPFVEQVQADAVRVGLETLVPRTEEAIRERNAQTGAGF